MPFFSKDTMSIANRMKDIKVPYGFKRSMIRPVLMALRETLLEQGKVTIRDLGCFWIERRKLPVAIGSARLREVSLLRFRPARGMAKEVVKKWNNPMVGPEKMVDEAALPLVNALFVDGKVQVDSSVGVEGVQEDTSTT